MFPNNCLGCHTYSTIITITPNDKVTTKHCMAKGVVDCPCSMCITKYMCNYKLHCLEFIKSIVKSSSCDESTLKYFESQSPEIMKKIQKTL